METTLQHTAQKLHAIATWLSTDGSIYDAILWED